MPKETMIGHIICGIVAGLSCWFVGKAYYEFRLEGGIFGTDKEINSQIKGFAKTMKKEANEVGKIAEKKID